MTRTANIDWMNYKELYHYDGKDGHTVIRDDAPYPVRGVYLLRQKRHFSLYTAYRIFYLAYIS